MKDKPHQRDVKRESDNYTIYYLVITKIHQSDGEGHSGVQHVKFRTVLFSFASACFAWEICEFCVYSLEVQSTPTRVRTHRRQRLKFEPKSFLCKNEKAKKGNITLKLFAFIFVFVCFGNDKIVYLMIFTFALHGVVWYSVLNPLSAAIDFKGQKLTSVNGRF